MARAVRRKENLVWAIGSFHPFKAAGADGVFPALLQKVVGRPTTKALREMLSPWLCARVLEDD